MIKNLLKKGIILGLIPLLLNSSCDIKNPNSPEKETPIPEESYFQEDFKNCC